MDLKSGISFAASLAETGFDSVAAPMEELN